MRIYIIAGEPSGDLLAAGLMRALLRTGRGVEFRGVGGNEMSLIDNQSITEFTSSDDLSAFGTAPKFRSLFDISEISVMGVVEVLPRLPLILKRIRQTVNDIEEFNPDVLVTVDSWGFVSAVLKKLRQRSGRSSSRPLPSVVHYVAPQVWAWKKGRARSVAQLVDRLMTLLPNEGQYFEKYGLRCDFVGHPIAERVAEARLDPAGFRASHGIPASARVVSVLPGSRQSEIRRLKPIFDKAAAILQARYEGLYFIEPSSSDTLDDRLNAFAISEIAIAKSGTVSLELTAVGVPHLIAYTFNRITNFLVKSVIKIRFANLINLLADREIIPEFVLGNCRAWLIAMCADELLSDPAMARKQVDEAREIMKKLQLPGVMPSDRAAEIVIEEGGRMVIA